MKTRIKEVIYSSLYKDYHRYIPQYKDWLGWHDYLHKEYVNGDFTTFHFCFDNIEDAKTFIEKGYFKEKVIYRYY